MVQISVGKPDVYPGTTLGAYHAPIRLQKLHRLKACRTAVGTGESEDPESFPEEALGTDINDQGRRHRAAAAMHADRQKPSRMQASRDMRNPLFWWQQVTTCMSSTALPTWLRAAIVRLRSTNTMQLRA